MAKQTNPISEFLEHNERSQMAFHILWYDYLQSYKSHIPEPKPTITTIRHAPDMSLISNTFEARSL